MQSISGFVMMRNSQKRGKSQGYVQTTWIYWRSIWIAWKKYMVHPVTCVENVLLWSVSCARSMFVLRVQKRGTDCHVALIFTMICSMGLASWNVMSCLGCRSQSLESHQPRRWGRIRIICENWWESIRGILGISIKEFIRTYLVFETSGFVYGLAVGFNVGYFWCRKPVNLPILMLGVVVNTGYRRACFISSISASFNLVSTLFTSAMTNSSFFIRRFLCRWWPIVFALFV